MLLLLSAILIIAIIYIFVDHAGEKRAYNLKLERIQQRLAEKEEEKRAAAKDDE